MTTAVLYWLLLLASIFVASACLWGIYFVVTTMCKHALKFLGLSREKKDD